MAVSGSGSAGEQRSRKDAVLSVEWADGTKQEFRMFATVSVELHVRRAPNMSVEAVMSKEGLQAPGFRNDKSQ